MIERMLYERGLAPELVRVGSAEAFRDHIEQGEYDAVLVDSGVPGFDGLAAIRLSKDANPHPPVIVCSGSSKAEDVAAALRPSA